MGFGGAGFATSAHPSLASAACISMLETPTSTVSMLPWEPGVSTWWRRSANRDHHRRPTRWERRARLGQLPASVPVIFLDVDGVICCNEENRLVGPQLDQLHRVCVATGAKVVLSTNWRRYADFKQALLTTLREARIGCVGSTPLLDEHSPVRPQEITRWLQRYSRGVRKWVALDDRDLLVEAGGSMLQGHFVHTSPSEGLTPSAADLAIEILGGERAHRRAPTPLGKRPAPSPADATAQTARQRPRRPPRTPPFTATNFDKHLQSLGIAELPEGLELLPHARVSSCEL